MRGRKALLPAALLLVAGLAVACTPGAGDPGDREPGRAGARSGCGPLAHTEVRGRTPAFLDRPHLSRFTNDHAVCAGVWGRTARGFVPQGLVTAGRTAWVSGLDANEPIGHRYCAVERVDLRTGERLDWRFPVTGQVGERPPVMCRHGGGLARDEHGLWLVETQRLWLLDPETLDVERAWALVEPVRGSFAVMDGDGRLGVGRWNPRRPGQVDWFDTDTLVSSSALDVTTAMADGSTRAPHSAQGAVWGALDGRKPGVWFAQSVTRCGVLVGPPGTRRRAFVPGAEGMALAGDGGLWVVSESGTRYYQEQGGRPVVPMLVRLDLADLDSWRRPDCTV